MLVCETNRVVYPLHNAGKNVLLSVAPDQYLAISLKTERLFESDLQRK